MNEGRVPSVPALDNCISLSGWGYYSPFTDREKRVSRDEDIQVKGWCIKGPPFLYLLCKGFFSEETICYIIQVWELCLIFSLLGLLFLLLLLLLLLIIVTP